MAIVLGLGFFMTGKKAGWVFVDYLNNGARSYVIQIGFESGT